MLTEGVVLSSRRLWADIEPIKGLESAQRTDSLPVPFDKMSSFWCTPLLHIVTTLTLTHEQ
jgi:hypothetical protein